MKSRILTSLSAAVCLFMAAAATAQTLSLGWYSIDGGGATSSAGGLFSLSATMGQPDAPPTSGAMTGGAYSLVGGFWPAATVCACRSDMNADTRRDSRDIQRFIGCVLAGGSCSCADVDGANGVTLADVSIFVTDILTGAACP